jgi:inosose dehydratase
MMPAASDRRTFLRVAGAVLSSSALASAQPKRKLKIGHTGITWGYKAEDAETAIKEVGSLGFQGYETFGEYLDAWELKGGLKPILDAAGVPLVSAYCNVNLTDASKRTDETAKIVRWAKLIQKCGGTTAVIGPNGVRRQSYDFNAAKTDVVTSLNEMSKAVADVGITPVLHQHTGTCVETRDEVYAVLDSVDTKVMKFGPDVGQLQKGGSDPVKVVKDFQSLIRHVHLKDWNGGQYWSEYCPLGQGKVDLPAVLDILEAAPGMRIIMVELDPAGRGGPMPPIETARTAKAYLTRQGYTFRA